MPEATPPRPPHDDTVAHVLVYSANACVIDGVPVTAPPYGDITEVALGILQHRAQQRGVPTRAFVRDERLGSEIDLLVHPDGSTEAID